MEGIAMKRKVQIEHEGALLIFTINDPMDGGEWEEKELEIQGDALPVLSAFCTREPGHKEYDAIMDRVGQEVLRQRRHGD
jgi:hypothetical protein